MYYIWGFHKNMRTRTDQAIKVYTPSKAKEKRAVVWDLKDREGNPHGDGKAIDW